MAQEHKPPAINELGAMGWIEVEGPTIRPPDAGVPEDWKYWGIWTTGPFYNFTSHKS